MEGSVDAALVGTLGGGVGRVLGGGGRPGDVMDEAAGGGVLVAKGGAGEFVRDMLVVDIGGGGIPPAKDGEAVCDLGGGGIAAGGGVSAPDFLLTHRFSTGS